MFRNEIELNGDSVINCEFERGQNTAVILARDIKHKIVSTIGFSAQERPTEVGLEIMKSALIAAMIGKFRRSMLINFDFELDPRSFEFASRLNSEVISSLRDANPPLLTAGTFKELRREPIAVIPNQVAIGDSGGRDSFVSGEILEDCGFALHKFKIDYDKTDPVADYSTYERNANGDSRYGEYEPFDIPITYFAPFWSLRDRMPEHIAIGLSFDVLGFDSNQRRAPYESPTAMRLHQEYLDALLGRNTRFIYPIASLSTYSVFEYIRRKFGLRELESRISCWNSEKNADCGYCDKCQRIKAAGSAMHLKGYEYLRGMPQVIDNHSYLFGNPVYNDLVKRYGGDALAESQLFSPELPFHGRVVDYLEKNYSRHHKTVNGQSHSDQAMRLCCDAEQMGERVGMQYDNLPADRINDISALLPYEQYFDRRVPVLAAHGEIPIYTDGLGWHYRRVCDGPRLEVPDSLLFRSFFNNH